jgi:hypothetical protein
MSDRADRYYRSSGRIPFGGGLSAAIGGLLSATVLALVYAVVSVYNPIIHITILATLAFAFGTGMAVNRAIYNGRIRSAAFGWAVAGLSGAVAVCAMWVWFLWVFTEFEWLPSGPGDVFAAMSALAHRGFWDLNGRRVKGVELWGLWAVEAAAVFGIIVATARFKHPFCESCERWTEDADIFLEFCTYDAQELRTALEDERYDVLEAALSAPPEWGHHFQANVQTCPACGETNLLTIVHLRPKPGKNEFERKTVVENLIVPRALVERLRARSSEVQEPDADHSEAEPVEDEEGANNG